MRVGGGRRKARHVLLKTRKGERGEAGRQGASLTLLIKLLANMTMTSPDYSNEHLGGNAARWPEFSRLEIFLYLSVCLFVE